MRVALHSIPKVTQYPIILLVFGLGYLPMNAIGLYNVEVIMSVTLSATTSVRSSPLPPPIDD